MCTSKDANPELRHSLTVKSEPEGKGQGLGGPASQLATHHLEWRQDEDDVANFATVLAPVLRALQPRDADVAPLQVLDIAAVAQ